MADPKTEPERIPYQPLHSSVREELEEAYVKYHDAVLRYLKPDTEWDPGWRTAPSRFASTSSRPVKVGSVRTLNLGELEIQIYTPDGVQPTAGWPAMLWFHGGMSLL